MSYYLFLDGVRNPEDVPDMMLGGAPWVVARSFEDFVRTILSHELPLLVSFGPGNCIETCIACARWLTEYCQGAGMSVPAYAVNSDRPSVQKAIHAVMEGQRREVLCGKS